MTHRAYKSLGPALLLWLFSVCGMAQVTDVSPLLSGTIDAVVQDDGYIVISGTRYAWRDPDVVITYNNREIRSAFLSAGQRVSYRARSDGSISMIAVVSPNRELDQVDSQ